MAIVYVVAHKDNGVLYIGKTVRTLDSRKRGHLDAIKRGSKTHFHNAIRKYGIDAFEWSILSETSNDDVCAAEMFWIAYFKRNDTILYNETDGGEGMHGRKATPEHKQRISSTLKETLSTNESKVQRSITMKNTWQDTEYAHKFQKDYGYVVSPTGEVHQVIGGRQFARTHGINESAFIRMLKGGRPSAQGWKRL